MKKTGFSYFRAINLVVILAMTFPVAAEVANGSGGKRNNPVGQTSELLQKKNEMQCFLNMKIIPLGSEKYIFVEGKTPQFDWENPVFASSVIGNCPLKIRWFDQKANEVISPTIPGRYIAYVEGTYNGTNKIRRAITMFCIPGNWDPLTELSKRKMFPHLNNGINPTKGKSEKQEWVEAYYFFGLFTRICG